MRVHSHVVQCWSRDLELGVYGNHQAIVHLELSEAIHPLGPVMLKPYRP
jgi:hypothetical protein